MSMWQHVKLSEQQQQQPTTTTTTAPAAASKVQGRVAHTTKAMLSVVVVCWLLNVPPTCECISGTDVLKQFYLLPH